MWSRAEDIANNNVKEKSRFNDMIAIVAQHGNIVSDGHANG